MKRYQVVDEFWFWKTLEDKVFLKHNHFCLLQLRVLETSSGKQKYWLHHDSHLLKCGRHIVVGAAHSGNQIMGTSYWGAKYGPNEGHLLV